MLEFGVRKRVGRVDSMKIRSYKLEKIIKIV